MQDEADRELLERARSGDSQALEKLLERHQAQVYNGGADHQTPQVSKRRHHPSLPKAQVILRQLFVPARELVVRHVRSPRFAQFRAIICRLNGPYALTDTR